MGSPISFFTTKYSLANSRQSLDLYVRVNVMTIFIKFCFFPGMHFSQAVAIIQSQVGVIKGVQVLYSDTVGFIHVDSERKKQN